MSVTQPEIEMDLVPDDVLEDIINLLPVKNQLVVKSVSKKFDELALNTTKVLNLEEIPPNRWLEVAKKMPKLTSLTGFRHFLDPVPNPDPEISFMKELATVNKNIIDMPNTSKLITCYIESVKELDPSYTGSGLDVFVDKKTYLQLLKKYPDLDIKCELIFDTLGFKFGNGSPAKFMADEGNTFNFSHVAVLDVSFASAPGVVELLEKTVNLEELRLEMTENPSSKFHRTLEAMAKNRYLRELQLEFHTEKPTDGSNKYKMAAEDYSSLRKVMSITTLRIVRLKLGVTADLQNVYDCIKESTNNNLDLLDVSFPESDSLRGTFIETKLTLTKRFDVPSFPIRSVDIEPEHQIYAGSLTEFSIVDFVHKFPNTRVRGFGIASDCDSYGNKSNMITREWDTVQTEFEQFIKSHPGHKYTLKRITAFPDEIWQRKEIIRQGIPNENL